MTHTTRIADPRGSTLLLSATAQLRNRVPRAAPGMHRLADFRAARPEPQVIHARSGDVIRLQSHTAPLAPNGADGTDAIPGGVDYVASAPGVTAVTTEGPGRCELVALIVVDGDLRNADDVLRASASTALSAQIERLIKRAQFELTTEQRLTTAARR